LFVCLKGCVLSFGKLHVQVFIQQNIMGAIKLVKMIRNAGGGWQHKKKSLRCHEAF